MKQNKKYLLLIVVSFMIGVLVTCCYSRIETFFYLPINVWDKTNNKIWDQGFLRITIPSSVDGKEQSAYFYKSGNASPMPLIVSLHTWSGNYSQNDPLAPMAKNEEWNYIHPDFRGPNKVASACLSNKVIGDIDDAISYAIDNGNIDTSKIFIVGVSGGGFATLGTYFKTHHQVCAFFTWAPISDLTAWYYQSSNRNSKYTQDILGCISSSADFDEKKAKLRSPLFWEIPKHPNGSLEIYAGINDGYTGSVPISHSILIYNHIAKQLGRGQKDLIDQSDIIKLLTRGVDKKNSLGFLGSRKIYYKRSTGLLSLVIFDGSHEMLPQYCFNRMKKIAAQTLN